MSLAKTQAISQIAGLLYEFLPGSGSAAWRGHVSFATVARRLGLGDYWIGGSKRPAITQLLQHTFDARPQLFTSLITTVVRAGLIYRGKQGNPLTREEVVELNGRLRLLEINIPELVDVKFLGTLPNRLERNAAVVPESVQGNPLTREEVVELNGRLRLLEINIPELVDVKFLGTLPNRLERNAAVVPESVQETSVLAGRLENLKEESFQLTMMGDRQQAGLALEKVLNETFNLFGLEPRSAFRVVGEQIDGSVLLDYETYLLEAKWTQHRTREDEMLVLRGKIEGKSAFTRGMFLSINGFSDDAIEAITKGKVPTFFLIDGFDLKTVLEGTIALPELLRYKIRRLAEEGSVFVRYPEPDR